MITMVYVKPALHPVKDEHGKHIAAEGTFVPHNQYWAIRLLHRDVVLAEPPAPTPPSMPELTADVTAVLPPRKRRGA